MTSLPLIALGISYQECMSTHFPPFSPTFLPFPCRCSSLHQSWDYLTAQLLLEQVASMQLHILS